MEQQDTPEEALVQEKEQSPDPNRGRGEKRDREGGKANTPIKPPERRRKYVPAIMMLVGGSFGSVTAYLLGYEMNLFLGITLFSLLFFFVLGNVFVLMLDKFDDQIEKARMDEGEVIEKEGTEEPGETEQAGESVS